MKLTITHHKTLDHYTVVWVAEHLKDTTLVGLTSDALLIELDEFGEFCPNGTIQYNIAA